jgi:hypothetical protein
MTDPSTTPSGRSGWRRYGLIGLLILLASGVIAGAAYLSGWLAADRRGPELYTGWQPSGADDSPEGLLTLYAPVDPAIVSALAYQPDAYGVMPLVVLDQVMPIGAYVPSSGNAHFQLTTPTPRPLAVLLPTSPPVLDSSSDSGILPTPTPDLSPLGGPPAEPYAGDGCAPRGLPTGGLFTQRFHWGHSGVDFGVPVGTPVLVTHSGTVIFAGWSTVGYGNLVIVQNGTFITYYAHLSRFNVVEGQRVGVGSVIAWTGNTGNSSGPHIHYEVRINDVPVDPMTFDNRGYPHC